MLDKIKNLFVKTPIEIVLLATIGLATATTLSLNYEKKREQMIPLGFSEITQIEKDAEATGKKVGPITSFLAKTNDATMKVFEASNRSWMPYAEIEQGQTKSKNPNKRFAEELQSITSPENKRHHYNLADLLTALPQEARKVKRSLNEGNFLYARANLPPITSEFGQTWTEKHHDETHTEVYTVTTTDSKGNTHTSLRTRSVYDYTDHWYTYHKECGEKASSELNQIVTSIPEVRLNEKVRATSRTNEEGERAAFETRKQKKGKDKLTRGEALDIASLWKENSSLLTYTEKASNLWRGLSLDNQDWLRGKANAKDHYKRTYTQHYDGPTEYQIVKRAESDGKEFCSSIDKALVGVKSVEGNIPKLEKDMQEYIEVALGNKEGDANKLRKDIMATTRQVYSDNFPGGSDISGFRTKMVWLLGLLGLATGAGIGFGVDRFVDARWGDGIRKYRRY